jgi:hypothetical protein
MVITELDKEWLQSQTRKLSALQRKLLREALRRSRRRDGEVEPGSFGVQSMMSQIEDGQVRARKRAAAGLSIARLIKRGLLERCCTRGRWRLTETGIEVAKVLARFESWKSPHNSENLSIELRFRRSTKIPPNLARFSASSYVSVRNIATAAPVDINQCESRLRAVPGGERTVRA